MLRMTQLPHLCFKFMPMSARQAQAVSSRMAISVPAGERVTLAWPPSFLYGKRNRVPPREAHLPSSHSPCVACQYVGPAARGLGPVLTNPLAVAATASSLGRETEDVRLASMAARVAAAARRAERGQTLDPRRDRAVLLEAERILRTGAAALADDPSKLPEHQVSRQTSYAFARLTNSVLNAPAAPPDQHDEPATRLAAARTLIELADNIQAILSGSGRDNSLIPIARNIEKTFDLISGNVLSALGRPGDSLGGSGFDQVTRSQEMCG